MTRVVECLPKTKAGEGGEERIPVAGSPTTEVKWRRESSVNTRSINRNQGTPGRSNQLSGCGPRGMKRVAKRQPHSSRTERPYGPWHQCRHEVRTEECLLGTRRVQRVATPTGGNDAVDKRSGTTNRKTRSRGDARGQGLKGTLGITACMSEPRRGKTEQDLDVGSWWTYARRGAQG